MIGSHVSRCLNRKAERLSIGRMNRRLAIRALSSIPASTQPQRSGSTVPGITDAITNMFASREASRACTATSGAGKGTSVGTGQLPWHRWLGVGLAVAGDLVCSPHPPTVPSVSIRKENDSFSFLPSEFRHADRGGLLGLCALQPCTTVVHARGPMCRSAARPHSSPHQAQQKAPRVRPGNRSRQ